MTDEQFLQEVKRYVHQIDPQAEVWLFGSRARGDAREDSDWDFLVLTDQPVNGSSKRRLRYHLYDIGYETCHTISTVIQSRRDAPFINLTDLYQNVMDEGKRL